MLSSIPSGSCNFSVYWALKCPLRLSSYLRKMLFLQLALFPLSEIESYRFSFFWWHSSLLSLLLLWLCGHASEIISFGYASYHGTSFGFEIVYASKDIFNSLQLQLTILWSVVRGPGFWSWCIYLLMIPPFIYLSFSWISFFGHLVYVIVSSFLSSSFAAYL